ncbi:hypothetical protein O3P69_002903 [Scylla paramamosain]|uniref:Uncharacterized protein n=1 Tax=Scylla paramamosain TaxID=85552 RepID=A0AAW0US26_SCYPA
MCPFPAPPAGHLEGDRPTSSRGSVRRPDWCGAHRQGGDGTERVTWAPSGRTRVSESHTGATPHAPRRAPQGTPEQ